MSLRLMCGALRNREVQVSDLINFRSDKRTTVIFAERDMYKLSLVQNACE